MAKTAFDAARQSIFLFPPEDLDMGQSEQEASAIFCRPVSWVTAGKVSVSAAVKLVKLDFADQVERLDELLAAGGKATVARVARAVKSPAGAPAGPIPPNRKRIAAAVDVAREGGMDEVAAALEWVLTGTCAVRHVLAKLAVA